MAVSNRFKAAGSKDIPSLRRAVNNAFTDTVTQINSCFNNLNFPVVSSLPTNPRTGQIVILTATSGGTAPGVRGYTGTAWV